VHPNKLGVAGHGFGGSAAVFAAAGMPAKPKAVVAIFPSVTKPSPTQPAPTLQVPGLVLAAPGGQLTVHSNAIELSRAWKTSTLRTVAKAEAGGLIEGRRLGRIVGLPGADRTTQKAVRGLLTGYLLHMLTGDKTYRAFADPEAVLPRTVESDPDAEPVRLEDKVVALLKG
jgi:hypothetical protein